ncbi:hypothetical protein CVT24_006973 [Panaeolus cyanescens]|uniref:Uncharacterized protein n=1 Tax=Panaeolus cyanescens TaxID=181874 RepID=A0A409YXA7_9AGAR|nr:hypothetical protein CVT24_006973 [Panaeolus cyanescens]
MVYIILNEDWSNWDVYKEATLSLMRARGLSVQLEFTHLPANKVTLSYEQWREPQYFERNVPKLWASSLTWEERERIGKDILFETLPNSIHQHLVGEKQLNKRWAKLQSSSVSPKSSLQIVGIPGGSGGADGLGDNDPLSVQPSRQALILNELKAYKCTTNKPLSVHLTLLRVLRDALARRNLALSDIEFVGIVLHSINPDSPIYTLLKTMIGRMKKANGSNDSGGIGRTKLSVDDVFDFLIDFDEEDGN